VQRPRKRLEFENILTVQTPSQQWMPKTPCLHAHNHISNSAILDNNYFVAK